MAVASVVPSVMELYQLMEFPPEPAVPVSVTGPDSHREAPIPVGAIGMALTVAITATRAEVLSHPVVVL